MEQGKSRQTRTISSDAIKEAGFIDLGSIKGNKGDQNYDIRRMPT